jgi:hypothetical protein
MAPTVLDPLAGALVDLLEALDVSEQVKGYKWEPGMTGFDRLPAAVVGIPSVQRVGVDEPESQLGSRDWFVSYPVDVYVRLDNSPAAAALAVEIVEALIVSIDTESLQAADGTVLDAKVTQSEPVLDLTDTAQPLLRYDCTVEIFKLVDQT